MFQVIEGKGKLWFTKNKDDSSERIRRIRSQYFFFVSKKGNTLLAKGEGCSDSIMRRYSTTTAITKTKNKNVTQHSTQYTFRKAKMIRGGTADRYVP